MLLGGHQDCWPGPQATDNAAGNACIMELARVFAAHRGELRRGLVCGFWTGHETGTMVGSSWFADHATGTGCATMPWRTCKSTSPLAPARPAGAPGRTSSCSGSIQAVEKELLGNRALSWQRAVKTGDLSFFGLGVPMLAGQGVFTEAELKATALATLGWWHHSIENTIDKLDWDYMADHLRVYAGWVWELCTAVVLPLEFVSVADQFIERLSALAGAGAPVGLDGALARAQALREAAVRLDATANAWRTRYAAGEKDEAAAEVLNACFKRLSRALVPLASTAKGAYGHDPYGYTPQGSMIPSLYDTPRLGKLPADSEERWMLETQLIRERNRLADVLGDCRLLVEEALRRVG